jgi:hypothetical protein
MLVECIMHLLQGKEENVFKLRVNMITSQFELEPTNSLTPS